MDYSNDQKTTVRHAVNLNAADLKGAVLRYMRDASVPNLSGVHPDDLRVVADREGAELCVTVAWQTSNPQIRHEWTPGEPSVKEDQRSPVHVDPGMGKYSVVADDGDKAKTAPIRFASEDLEECRVYMEEEGYQAASLVWVRSDGVRFTVDKQHRVEDRA